MAPSVSILIPTHNRAELLTQTLASLETLQVPPSVEVDLIVVANACTDDTVSVCESAFPNLPLPARCVEEAVPGLSVARNRAVDETTGTICAFLDDDVSVSPGWLKAMLDVYDNYPADIVGGRTDLWWQAIERPEWFSPNLDSLLSLLDHGDKVVELFPPRGIVGANFSFRREVFTRTGEFRTDLGRRGKELVAAEESEFCLRALKQGARIFYAPNMQLKHWVAPQRVNLDYLIGVARGGAIGRIRSKEPFGIRQFLRSFVGHLYLTVRYELTRWYAKLTGDRSRDVTALVLRNSAAAAMATSVRRVLSLPMK